MKMEFDLQKVREVIVGLNNTLLYELESYSYLTQAPRYALSKIPGIWHLVTLSDISVWYAQECSSA